MRRHWIAAVSVLCALALVFIGVAQACDDEEEQETADVSAIKSASANSDCIPIAGAGASASSADDDSDEADDEEPEEEADDEEEVASALVGERIDFVLTAAVSGDENGIQSAGSGAIATPTLQELRPTTPGNAGSERPAATSSQKPVLTQSPVAVPAPTTASKQPSTATQTPIASKPVVVPTPEHLLPPSAFVGVEKPGSNSTKASTTKSNLSSAVAPSAPVSGQNSASASGTMRDCPPGAAASAQKSTPKSAPITTDSRSSDTEQKASDSLTKSAVAAPNNATSGRATGGTSGIASVTAADAGGETVRAYMTSYTYHDNNPPGKGISWPKVHNEAGGTGTYEDPVTIAVPQSGANKIFAPGTIFYIPDLKRYFIAEDECGTCTSDQGTGVWVDIWTDDATVSSPSTSVRACADSMETTREVVVNPSPGLPVDAGGLFDGGKCYSSSNPAAQKAD